MMVKKWWGIINEQKWGDMFDDNQLEKELGSGWWKKRKQAPQAWLRRLRSQNTGSPLKLKRKGRTAYEDMQGPRGDAARELKCRFQELVEQDSGTLGTCLHTSSFQTAAARTFCCPVPVGLGRFLLLGPLRSPGRPPRLLQK